MNSVKPYLKAIVALVGVAVTIIGPEFANDDDVQRWLRIAAGLATAVGVYLAPNKDPQALHQSESVQPPGA